MERHFQGAETHYSPNRVEPVSNSRIIDHKSNLLLSGKPMAGFALLAAEAARKLSATMTPYTHFVRRIEEPAFFRRM